MIVTTLPVVGGLLSRPFDRLPAREAWGEQLRRWLVRSPGSVVLTGVPVENNSALLDLAHCLGPVTARGTMIEAHPLEDGRVYRVESVNAGHGVEDEDGLLIFSTTTHDFEGHTDGYHNAMPPAFVLLLCVRPDRGEFGRTTVVDGREAVTGLSGDTVRLLSDPVYPCSFGQTAILAGSSEQPSVRFNLKEIERFHAAGHSLDDVHLRAARDFGEVLADPDLAQQHVLAAGECLVLDNRRALHAREALSPDSKRLLKRVWVEAEDGAA